MIYLVTANQELFESNLYKYISVEESIEMMGAWNKVQYDSETNGRDAHVNHLLCAQFGNKEANAQIVVDCSTIDIKRYKGILEAKLWYNTFEGVRYNDCRADALHGLSLWSSVIQLKGNCMEKA